MTQQEIIDVLRGAFSVALQLALPLLAVSLAVGLIVAIIQAATSIQEQTLTFVPKLLIIGIVLVLLAPLMMTTIRDYVIGLFRSILNYM